MTTATCQHHWVIGEPGGLTSEGRCKRCGETKEFTNTAPWYGQREFGRQTYSPNRLIQIDDEAEGELR